MTKYYFGLIFLFASILYSACTMKGYYVDINSNSPDKVILQVRKLLIENGFKKDNEVKKSYQLERYKCEPPEIKRTFFNRNADLWVYVDIRHTSSDLEIRIYNAYVGNKPEIKIFLLKTADSIEKEIKQIAPGIIVNRDEGLTGKPFI